MCALEIPFIIIITVVLTGVFWPSTVPTQHYSGVDLCILTLRQDSCTHPALQWCWPVYSDPQAGQLYPPSITVVLTCVFWPSGWTAVPTQHYSGVDLCILTLRQGSCTHPPFCWTSSPWPPTATTSWRPSTTYGYVPLSTWPARWWQHWVPRCWTWTASFWLFTGRWRLGFCVCVCVFLVILSIVTVYACVCVCLVILSIVTVCVRVCV